MGMIIDPIADMLVRIKNANQRKHRDVSMPYSKQKNEIAKILKQEGYIISFKKETVDKQNSLVVVLKYKSNQRVITGIKRISKPGLRVYTTADNLPKVLSGFGIAIISTSQGVKTDKEARVAQIGGEVLAYV
jgi:small subunit ribosomal protein S8